MSPPFVISNFNIWQQTGASEDALRHREGHIREANAACVLLSQCATRKFPPHEICGNTGTTTAASGADAAAYTKEVLIAPRDGTCCRIPAWKKRDVVST